jgi:predicted ribosomally synthesized peptide with SipW-like signal peptide
MKAKLNQKVVALAAAGLVLLSGATVTSLAAWTDTEWVNGGVGTTPGVSSSMFDVEQNVTTLSASADWTNNAASPGGIVDFGTAASTLTPGTSVVGFVRLRTIANSVGGTLTLKPAAGNATGTLMNALTYGAWLHPSSGTCTTSDYNGAGFTELVPDGSPLTTASLVPFSLDGSSGGLPGDEQTVCFRLTLPPLGDPTDRSLEGQSADPIWQFSAISN